MIKVFVSGSKGRMGQEVIKAVTADSGCELVGQADMGDDLEALVKESHADVVVDFTAPEVRMTNFKAIINGGARPVMGTTGYTEEDIKELSALCDKARLCGIIAPNFTLGAILLMKFAQEAAKYLDCAELIEYHHDKKVDYPSGTAVKVAQLMQESREKFNPGVQDKVANMEGARGAETAGLHIHSVRLPGMMAHQEVIFGAQGQTLTLRHDSISRDCYMPGVMMAVKKAMENSGLIYGLEHLM